MNSRFHRCCITKKKDLWLIKMGEIVMEEDWKAETIEGELALGSLSFRLSDYLLLQPGDEVVLDQKGPLSGILRIQGVAVGTGRVSFEDGLIRVCLGSKEEARAESKQ